METIKEKGIQIGNLSDLEYVTQQQLNNTESGEMYFPEPPLSSSKFFIHLLLTNNYDNDYEKGSKCRN